MTKLANTTHHNRGVRNASIKTGKKTKAKKERKHNLRKYIAHRGAVVCCKGKFRPIELRQCI